MSTAKKKPAKVDFKLIAQWLKYIRADKKLPLITLAERTGYTTEFLADIELGKKSVDITTLFNILDGLECDLILRRRKPEQETLFDVVATGDKGNGRVKGKARAKMS